MAVYLVNKLYSIYTGSMPGKRKSNNYDAVGGIFGFIFAEAQKPRERRRPVKRPTGISASSVLTDAIFASLENPGVFISDTIVKEFNDALDIKIAQIDFLGGRGGLKLSSNSIGNWIRDPGGQVQRAINNAKADRKASRARMLGETMDDFLTTAWAHKYGDLEAKEIVLASAAAREKAESYKIARAIGQNVKSTPTVEKDFMINRTVDLIGEKTFGMRWHSMSEREKMDFSHRLAVGSTHRDMIDFLTRAYGAVEANNFDHALKKRSYDEVLDIYDAEVYRELENSHLTEKIDLLRGAAPGSKEEKQRKIYEKARLFVNLRRKEEIAALQAQLKKGGLSPDERRETERKIRDAEIAQKVVGGRNTIVTNIGKWEGYLGTISMLGGPLGTNVVGSVLSGDFFDSRKNQFAPVQAVKVQGMPGVEIYVAKKDKNKVQNVYNEMGEALYYATPRALFRTFFFNGELFARGLYKTNGQLKELLDASGTGVLGSDVVNGILSLRGKDLDRYIHDTLEAMRLHIGSGHFSQEDLDKLEKLLKQSKNFKNLTNVFSMPARTKKLIEDSINKVFNERFRKMREGIVNSLMNNPAIKDLITKTFGDALLKEFVARGGLRNLIRPLVSAIAGALGLSLTPVVSIVITIVVNVAMDLVGKIAKVFVQIMLVAMVGFFAAIVLLGGSIGSWKKWNRKTFSYNYAVPGTVSQCPAYGGYSIPRPERPSDQLLDPRLPADWRGAGDVNEVFRRAKAYVSSMYGSVGTNLVLLDCSSGSDPTGMCARIGWAWCYSASSIYCKVDKLTKTSSQYAFSLFVHELLHQLQRGGSTDLREWGADYLSDNGGGYTFSTPSGCKKATQINTSSCSGQDAVNVALGRDTSSNCYRQISSQILGRFCQ